MLRKQILILTLVRICLVGAILSPLSGNWTSVGAQSSDATLTGTVVDSTGGVLPAVEISLVNSDTGLTRRIASERDGTFVLTVLPPGRYVLRASVAGFLPTEMRGIVLQVNDRVDVKVQLQLASMGEGVTVIAEAEHVRTSPAVSTVVDRQFVENLPLNGRSLQALLELTPGVVLTRVGSSSLDNGQFSVNGQRANANSFMLDGVSANAGVTTGSTPVPGQSGSGQLPAMTALGGTNGLVSVDALQEFRIQTSSYAPEFGRTAGGQISMVTRSGTNAFHGTLFEYFRDERMDATDWFTNRSGQAKPALSQHDFGGVLGGPIFLNRTFFFGSYEGLRLLEPRTVEYVVHTAQVRQNALPELRPYLDAIPLPNGRDLGGGSAQFVASFSNPSRFDSTSVKIDHNVGRSMTLFGRGSYAPSYLRSRVLAYTSTTNQNNTSVTAGSTWVLSSRLVHDVRVNYTANDAPFEYAMDDFGGAVPPSRDVFQLQGIGPDTGYLQFFLTNGGSWLWGVAGDIEQRQFNIVDSVTLTTRSHEWKAGFDYRRVSPLFGREANRFDSLRFDLSGLPTGRVTNYANSAIEGRHAAAYDNFSLYVQDNWKAMSRLTLTYGLRWEYVPPPHATEGSEAITLENMDSPYGGQVHLAPANTPLWRTRYTNIGPRIGASYMVSDRPGSQLVLKAGFGLFHDLGLGQSANSYARYPFSTSKAVTNLQFPLAAENMSLPILGKDPPQAIAVMDRDIEMPLTTQWNVSAERALGLRQRLTVGYVGARGHRLLKMDRYMISLLDWPTARTPVFIQRNNGRSDYQALQLQFQRRLDRGFQSLVSYTWGRSRDTASSDNATNIPAERLPSEADYGYSDFDVRHVFTSALTYQTTNMAGGSLLRRAVRDWGVDVLFRMRSGVPVNVTTLIPFPPDNQSARPDVVPGQPFWIDDDDAPGDRRLNRQAFSTPAPATQGNLPRGAVRGFAARQLDLALRRDVRIAPRVRLQLRFEMFNLFNTPNFADPQGLLIASDFGLSSVMLGRSLGGLSALYQIGGPRSSQLTAKLLF